MRIFVCQIKPKIGDIKGNYELIKNHYEEALSYSADICLFPELATSGYMAEDLFTINGIIQDIQKVVLELINITKQTCLLIPTALVKNGKLYNSVIVAQNGQIIGTVLKKHLPNYSVFDEKRYFTSGEPNIVIINGVKIGIPICEDMWFEDVCTHLSEQGAEILLVPNASPYTKSKMAQRVKIVQARYAENNIPVVYCNQVIGQDGVIFDGRSFCYDGELKIIGKGFAEDKQLIEFINGKFIADRLYNSPLNALRDDLYQEILDAIILGLKDYVLDNGFKKVILGLSGGIDSAVVACLAVMALGKENVSVYMLPSKFTSAETMEDAYTLALNLDIAHHLIDISTIFDSFIVSLNVDNTENATKRREIKENSIAYQNLQARIRGTILMTEANNNDSLLLVTGNKSEYATGYTTIYGDMNGAFAPIKDLYKTELYKLADHINKLHSVIPIRIMNRPPTAELAFNQKDSDALPEYEILDPLLEDHIENRLVYYELVKKYDANIVKKVITLVKNSEFKRRQSAIGVKISEVNFEKDRRFPITNLYF